MTDNKKTDNKKNNNQIIGTADASDGAVDAAQRQLIAAYLSYARDEVAVLSPTGLRLLEMTIASLTNGVNVVGAPSRSLS